MFASTISFIDTCKCLGNNLTDYCVPYRIKEQYLLMKRNATGCNNVQKASLGRQLVLVFCMKSTIKMVLASQNNHMSIYVIITCNYYTSLSRSTRNIIIDSRRDNNVILTFWGLKVKLIYVALSFELILDHYLMAFWAKTVQICTVESGHRPVQSYTNWQRMLKTRIRRSFLLIFLVQRSRLWGTSELTSRPLFDDRLTLDDAVDTGWFNLTIMDARE